MKYKRAISLVIISAMLAVLNLTWQVSAQKINEQARTVQELSAGEVSKRENLKKVFDEEISKSKLQEREPSVDFKKLEKSRYKQDQDDNKGLDKKAITFLVVFAVAVTVIVVLVAKYGKVPKCNEIYCPSGETCPCEN